MRLIPAKCKLSKKGPATGEWRQLHSKYREGNCSIKCDIVWATHTQWIWWRAILSPSFIYWSWFGCGQQTFSNAHFIQPHMWTGPNINGIRLHYHLKTMALFAKKTRIVTKAMPPMKSRFPNRYVISRPAAYTFLSIKFQWLNASFNLIKNVCCVFFGGPFRP